MSNQVSQYQFRQIIGSAVGLSRNYSWPASEDLTGDLLHVLDTGLLKMPEDPSSLFVLPDRVAVFKDINMKQRSVLAQCLSERDAETALVVDAFLTGKEALHFVKLFPVSAPSDVHFWLDSMSLGKMSITIKPIDESTQIMAASLLSFVSSGVS